MMYDDKFLYRLFDGRCVICKQRATEINHIVPRSENKALINDWRNKVPMCHTHHEEYHDGGVTEEKIFALRHARAAFLLAKGKGAYI